MIMMETEVFERSRDRSIKYSILLSIAVSLANAQWLNGYYNGPGSSLICSSSFPTFAGGTCYASC